MASERVVKCRANKPTGTVTGRQMDLSGREMGGTGRPERREKLTHQAYDICILRMARWRKHFGRLHKTHRCAPDCAPWSRTLFTRLAALLKSRPVVSLWAKAGAKWRRSAAGRAGQRRSVPAAPE